MTRIGIRALLSICICLLITVIGVAQKPVAKPGTKQSATKSSKPRLKNEEVLTNDAVIQLVKAGLGDELVMKKITQSKTKFDLSTAQLVRLKQEGVSSKIIECMMDPAACRSDKPTQPPQASAPDPPKPTTATNSENSTPLGRSTSASGGTSGGIAVPPKTDSKHSSYTLPPDKGAYLWDGEKLHLLYQSTVPSIGQNFWRQVTPFVRKKFELQLIGPFAKSHFDNPQPIILVSGLGEVIPGVPSFRLLYVKTGGMLKDRRIVGVYDVGGFFGSIRMVDNEIECELKKVAEGIYAITPLKPLQDGEYGLVQVPKLAEASSRPSFAPPIWDFGVYSEKHPIDKKQ